jgi:hypothetical protein
MEEHKELSQVPIRTCVVYDKEKGNIIHIHHHHAMSSAGAASLSEAKLESEALDLANDITGTPKSNMAVLHVENESLQPDIQYEIDVKRKVLVAKEDQNDRFKPKEDPVNILKLRLAKGEITKDEYEDLYKVVKL